MLLECHFQIFITFMFMVFVVHRQFCSTMRWYVMYFPVALLRHREHMYEARSKTLFLFIRKLPRVARGTIKCIVLIQQKCCFNL